MNDERKEIKINKANKSITFINNGIAFSQFGIADEILDLITNLQQSLKDMTDINLENEKELTNLQQIEQEHKKINGELREENSKLEIALQNIQEDYDKRIKENERLKEENIEIRQCLLIKRRSIPHKLTMDKSIEEILDMPTYEDYKSRCKKASDKIQYIIDYGFDYDGFDTVESLKGLIDMLVDYARESKNILQNGSEEK